jgi:hypothetical protein
MWVGNMALMKIKSHAGCLMNERADELADIGRIGIIQSCALILIYHYPSTVFCRSPNQSILNQIAKFNSVVALKLRQTNFVTNLLHQKEGATVSEITQLFQPSVYRVWLKCIEGINSNVPTPDKQSTSSERVGETLTHFACVCPKFRVARTSAGTTR